MLRDIHENAILGAYEGYCSSCGAEHVLKDPKSRASKGAISLLEMRQTDGSRSEIETDATIVMSRYHPLHGLDRKVEAADLA